MLQPYSVKKSLIHNVTQRVSLFEYLCILVFIIYAGRANTFVITTGIKENPIGFIFPVVLSFFLAIKWKVSFGSRFFNLVYGLGLYFLAISIKVQSIHVTIFLSYLALFFIVYTVVYALNFNFFKIYEFIIVHFAIMGLGLWGVQILLGGDSLFNIFSKISGITVFSSVTGNGLNALIYSVQPLEHVLKNQWISIPRNCGFTWEPGAFSVYLCLAIFINLFLSNNDKKSKIRFWVLFFALISTQSTTGFVIFITIMLFYYVNKNQNLVLVAFPFIVAVLVYIFSLPFMGDKIISLLNETKNVDEIVERSIGNEVRSNPQRFVSFMIAYRDFLQNPILGIGGARLELSWTAKLGSNISVISGIGNLLARTGLVGFLFFIIISIKSSILISQYYKYKGKLLLLILILFISISYTIILLPLIAFFWMFSIYEHSTQSKSTMIGNKNKIIEFNS